MIVKILSENLNGTDSREPNHFADIGSITYFDKLSFQAQIGKN